MAFVVKAHGLFIEFTFGTDFTGREYFTTEGCPEMEGRAIDNNQIWMKATRFKNRETAEQHPPQARGDVLQVQ